jgi:hypothetical protein
MGAAFCSALALAVLVLAVAGADARGTVTALRVTARFSFLLFWLAYTGKALATLFGQHFAPIARRGREFGLAFASAHLVHVALLVWLYQISTRPPVSEGTFVFFGIGLVWTYLLALFSIKRLAQAIGPAWRILRFIGLEYIALAFFADFVFNPLLGGTFEKGPKAVLEYLPFSILTIIGPVLRLATLPRWPSFASRATP